MENTAIFDHVSRHGIIPVAALESAEAALPLADALIAGGLPVLEITFRTQAVAKALETLSKERPQLILGAGTVLTPENARVAKECGAQFAVSPGVNPRVVEAAQAVGLPFAPGVATPSDMEAAMALGCRVMKFFPSEALGGLTYIKAATAPYSHTGLRLIPTGGINMDNLTAYLSTPPIIAVGGTWIVQKKDIDEAQWEPIRARTEKTVAAVRALRGQA